MVWDLIGFCDVVGLEFVWLLRDLSCGVLCLMLIFIGNFIEFWLFWVVECEDWWNLCGGGLFWWEVEFFVCFVVVLWFLCIFFYFNEYEGICDVFIDEKN